MKHLAVIPARIGSKGLLKKNIQSFNNAPLVHHTIKAALDSKIFARVVLSTDSTEIAEVCKEFLSHIDFRVMFRPEATDKDPLAPVVYKVFTTCEREMMTELSTVCTLQPTSPLRTERHIREAYDEYKCYRADSLLSVTEERHSLWLLNNGIVQPIIYHRENRQYISPVWKGNGAIFITSRRILLHNQDRLGGKIALYIMDERDSADIHTEEDLKLAEWYTRTK